MATKSIKLPDRDTVLKIKEKLNRVGIYSSSDNSKYYVLKDSIIKCSPGTEVTQENGFPQWIGDGYKITETGPVVIKTDDPFTIA